MRVPPPATQHRGWIRNPIDAFILAGLESNGLAPAPEANRPALLRRLSFDLTGLPPSPEEVEAFLRDRSPDAYEKLVDRLLASPQYGVRQAQHWLDLARYADTDGFEFDQARPNAWRYRDWVIDALNRDMPYDRFVRLQLAGDEIAPEDPSAFVATGLQPLLSRHGRPERPAAEAPERAQRHHRDDGPGLPRPDDRLRPLPRPQVRPDPPGRFLPAPGVLRRFAVPRRLSPGDVRAAEGRTRKPWPPGKLEVAKVQAAILRIEKPVRDRLAPGLPMGALDDAVAAYNTPESARTPAQVATVYGLLSRDGRIRPATWPRLLDHAEATRRQELLAELDRVDQCRDPVRCRRPAGSTRPDPAAPPTYFLRRGELTARGPAVAPAIPTVLRDDRGRPIRRSRRLAGSSGRRRALADWLTRPDHPMTARVMVNRLWQGHFGRGLVGTSSDFGRMGDEPSHPELLDWLATELVARGWSLKSMHRLIVTSATYRQSSRPRSPAECEADPENRWLSGQNRRRLDGETIRDALLAASRRLNPALGGPGVFPPLPPELTKLSSKGAIWPVSVRVEDQSRRSLYVFVRRNLRYPFFEAFDRPDTNASCPKRPVTTIAPQALSLLNSPLSSEAAHALAARAEQEGGQGLDSKVERAYLLTLGRRPDETERALARDFLSARGSSFADFCLALINLNEFVYVD